MVKNKPGSTAFWDSIFCCLLDVQRLREQERDWGKKMLPFSDKGGHQVSC